MHFRAIGPVEVDRLRESQESVRVSACRMNWNTQSGAPRPAERDTRTREPVGIPLNQVLSIGSYIVGQHLMRPPALSARADARAAVSLQPGLRRCGKIDYPDKILNQRLSVEDCLDAIDECGAPVVVDRRRRAAAAQGDRRRSSRARRAPAICDRLHQCAAAWRRSSTSTSRSPISTGRCISTATRRCTTSRSARRASTTARSPRSSAPRRGAFASTSTARCSTTPSPSASRASSTTVDGDWASTASRSRLATLTSARPTSSISSTATRTKQLFRDIFSRGDGGTHMAVQPVEPVPRFSRRQSDLSLHAVGQSDAHRVRLAAALLSARRRLRQDLQRTDGRDRLGRATAPATTRSAPTAWCIAASRRPPSWTRCASRWKLCDVSVARHQDRRADGARDPARSPAARPSTFSHATSSAS